MNDTSLTCLFLFDGHAIMSSCQVMVNPNALTSLTQKKKNSLTSSWAQFVVLFPVKPFVLKISPFIYESNLPS